MILAKVSISTKGDSLILILLINLALSMQTKA